jgi:RimJ/RimL family protein N-acetyltransferase
VVTLRPVHREDAEVIFEAWGRHPQNFAYLLARVFADVEDARRYIEALFPSPESKAFHIVNSDDRVVGIVKAPIHGHHAKIGYVVHEPFWGRGIATEAVRQMLATIERMPNVSRVWATCALENPASARVLEKCGFQREGILRNWATYPAHGGKPLDNYSYVRIP